MKKKPIWKKKLEIPLQFWLLKIKNSEIKASNPNITRTTGSISSWRVFSNDDKYTKFLLCSHHFRFQCSLVSNTLPPLKINVKDKNVEIDNRNKDAKKKSLPSKRD